MPKKEEPKVEGAPEWMLTYGDMVTLLLCFFVLLFSMSEIKSDKLTKTMRAFQQQFGVLPKYKATVQVFVQAQRMTETEAFVLRQGPPGRNPNVQKMVDDDKVKKIVGGQELFEPNSAKLKPSGQQLLRQQIAPDLQGYDNRIEVRGHTAATAYDPASGYRDAWELGYLRAQAVMRFLVDDCGINEKRFRVSSCGDTEPRDTNLTDEGRTKNRRVEIIMTEESIPDIGLSGKKSG